MSTFSCICKDLRLVHVTSYVRVRKGRIEHVCEHCRPYQSR